MRIWMLLVLLGGVAIAEPAVPFTPGKLELIPNLLPKQRRELARRLRPLLPKGEGIERALVEAGVDPEIVSRLMKLPPGPLLVERYSHQLVLDAPDLSAAQRELLEYLHPSVLAA